MNKKLLECPVCGKKLTPNNYNKHVNSCKRLLGKITFKVDHDGLNCKYCGKLCKNKNSLCNHERLCTKNPLRQESNFKKLKGKCSYRKGLDHNNCECIQRQQETFKRNKALGLHKSNHRKHTEEEKEKLRSYALKNNLGGFNMHKIKYVVDGKIVDSTYEKLLAEDLTRNNIRWERCKRFKYIDLNNKLHYYTPDFYLPDYDVYIDPKNDYLINNINPILGYKDIDKIKWVEQQNNIKIIVLDKNHLNFESILYIINDKPM